MATSTIKNINGAEEVSVTLLNNFELPTWGYVRAFKIGSLCIVAISGLRRPTAVTTNTACIRLGVTSKYQLTGGLIDGNNESAILQADTGSSDLLVNTMNANTAYFGQIIFPIA